MIIQPRHHDVRSLHQADVGFRIDADLCGQHLVHPRARSIDQHARDDGVALAGHHVFDRELPAPATLPRLDGAHPRVDLGAATSRVARIQDHEAGVIDLAIRIFEALGEAPRQQRLAGHIAAEIEGPGRRQQPAAAEMVVEEQAKSQQPGRPQAGMVRQHEP